jgi:hypothetical protein
MTERAYNGFPAEYRNRREAERSKLFKTGSMKRPLRCRACGLHSFDGATIHAHDEDYHDLAAFVGLCYCCHMAVHKRFQDLKRWDAWRRAVSAGWKPPMTRDYRLFIKLWESPQKPFDGVPDINNWLWLLSDNEPDLFTGRDPVIPG